MDTQQPGTWASWGGSVAEYPGIQVPGGHLDTEILV